MRSPTSVHEMELLNALDNSGDVILDDIDSALSQAQATLRSVVDAAAAADAVAGHAGSGTGITTDTTRAEHTLDLSSHAEALLAALRRLPGLSALLTDPSNHAQPLPLSMGEATGETVAASPSETGSDTGTAQVRGPEAWLHSKRGLSLCHSAFLALVEMESAQQSRGDPTTASRPSGSHQVETSYETMKRAAHQSSQARAKLYANAAAQLQRLLRSGSEVADSGEDGIYRAEERHEKPHRDQDKGQDAPPCAQLVSGAPLAHGHHVWTCRPHLQARSEHFESNAKENGAGATGIAARVALAVPPSSPTSSSSSSLFGTAVAAGSGADARSPNTERTTTATKATAATVARGVEVVAALPPPTNLLVVNEPEEIVTIAASHTEHGFHHPTTNATTNEAMWNRNSSGEHLLSGSARPCALASSSDVKGTTVAATGATEGAMKTYQRAWTDTQLLQAALRRGVSAAATGQMAIAANDFALIVKLLFKKCFVVEELIMTAIRAGKDEDKDDGSSSDERDDSDSGGEMDNSYHEGNSGNDGPATPSSTPPFDPDAITMSLLPPGLDDEDYEEERKYLEAKLRREHQAQRNLERPPPAASTSRGEKRSNRVNADWAEGAERKAKRNGGICGDGRASSLEDSAWVVRALAKVHPDALPLSTLQSHCHLAIPKAYVAVFQRGQTMTRQDASRGSSPVVWGARQQRAHGGGDGANADDQDGDSLRGNSDSGRLSPRRAAPPLSDMYHFSPAIGSPSRAYPCESASALERRDADPLAALMPALKSSSDEVQVRPGGGVGCRGDAFFGGNDDDKEEANSEEHVDSPSDAFSLTALFAALLWNIALPLWEDGYFEDAYQWLCATDVERLMAVARRVETADRCTNKAVGDVGTGGHGGVDDVDPSAKASQQQQKQRRGAMIARAESLSTLSWERLTLHPQQTPRSVCTRAATNASTGTGTRTATSAARGHPQPHDSGTNIVLAVGVSAPVPLRSSGTSLLDLGGLEAVRGEERVASEHATHPLIFERERNDSPSGSIAAPHNEDGHGISGTRREPAPDGAPGDGPLDEPLTRAQALWCLAEKIASLRDLCAIIICCESADDVLFLVCYIGAALREKDQHLDDARRVFVGTRQPTEAAATTARGRRCYDFNENNTDDDDDRCQDTSVDDDNASRWQPVEKDDGMAEVLLTINLLIEFFLAKRARKLIAEYAQQHAKVLASTDSYYRQFGGDTGHHRKHATSTNTALATLGPLGDGDGDDSGGACVPTTAAAARGAAPTTTSAGETHQQRDDRAMTAACDELVCAFTAGHCFTLSELERRGMPTPADSGTMLAPGLPYILALNVFSSVLNYASLYRLSKVYRGVVAREGLYRNRTTLGQSARGRQQQQQQQGASVSAGPTPVRASHDTGKGMFSLVTEAASEWWFGSGRDPTAPSPAPPVVPTRITALTTTNAVSGVHRNNSGNIYNGGSHAPALFTSPDAVQRAFPSESPVDSDPVDTLDYTHVDWGCLPLPSQRAYVRATSTSSLTAAAAAVASGEGSQQLRRRDSRGLIASHTLAATHAPRAGSAADSSTLSTSAITIAAASSGVGERVVVRGVHLLPEFPTNATIDVEARSLPGVSIVPDRLNSSSMSNTNTGVSNASNTTTTMDRHTAAATLARNKRSDAAMRLLLVLTRFSVRPTLEVVPASTIHFVAQELNKAMHILQAELQKRRGKEWYSTSLARSHAEVHRFYAEALEEVQQRLPLPLAYFSDIRDLSDRATSDGARNSSTSNMKNGTSSDPATSASRYKHAALTLAGNADVPPPSMPRGERLPLSPNSRLPSNQDEDRAMAASDRTRSGGETPAQASHTRTPVGRRTANEHARELRCEPDACFSSWWGRPLSIPSDATLREKKRNLKQIPSAFLKVDDGDLDDDNNKNDHEDGDAGGGDQTHGESGMDYDWRVVSGHAEGYAGRDGSSTQSGAKTDETKRRTRGGGGGGLPHSISDAAVPVAWDAPPAFTPDVTIDFSTFTTTSVETQLATKRMVADAVTKQRALQAVCRSESARRNVRRGGVSLLSAACRQLVHDELPMLQQYCNWRVIYSTKFHGVSFQTLMKACQQEAEAAAVQASSGGVSSGHAPRQRPMLLVMELTPSTTNDFAADGSGVKAAAQALRDADLAMEQQRRAARGNHSGRSGHASVSATDSAATAAATTVVRPASTNSIIVGAYLSDLLTMNSRRYYGSSDTFVFHILLPAAIDDELREDEDVERAGQVRVANETQESGGNATSAAGTTTAATAATHSPQPSLRAYHSTDANSQYINCRLHSIVVGGGGGGSAIYIDDSLVKGASSRCATFGSPPLTRWSEGAGKAGEQAAVDESMASFEVLQLEAIVID